MAGHSRFSGRARVMRPRRSVRWRRLPFLFAFAASVVVDGLLPEGKETPEKGDAHCPSLAERYNDFRQGGGADVWLTPCPDEGSTGNEDFDIPPHGIVLELFTSLPAYAGDFQTLISWAVIGYLDEAALEYKVQSNLTVPVDFFNYTERRANPVYAADVIFQQGVARPIRNGDASVWYHYQFLFLCFYGNANDATMAGQPMTDDPNALLRIRQQLNQYMREGIALVNDGFAFRDRSCGLLGLSIEDPRYAALPFQDGPLTPAPTAAPTAMPVGDDDFRTASPATGELPPKPSRWGAPPLDGAVNYITYTRPMNAQDWDWRRYLGLGLFVGTVAGTLLLTQWAARRRRRITTQHVWGHHLGTEQGVDALLSTGWKVRGSKMEVFNKEKAGYRDDDSILLGGYEPTAYLGAEITVTQDSNTTPEDG